MQIFSFRKYPKPGKDDIKVFVDSNLSPETELQQWTPEDWRPNPDIDVKTENATNFCNSLNGLWQLLGRKMSTTIRDSQERFSLLYLPNPFIVPGGRFRETYYWDSFWIIRGLLVCGMAETARGMIDNLCSMVTRLGYVPNGSRLYYTRSQPPVLAMMVETYLASTGDTQWAVTRAGAKRQLLPQLSFATSSVRPSSGDHVKMWTAERAVSLAQVSVV